MPRELYQIYSISLEELNRILAQISERLNFLYASGANTAIAGKKITGLASAVIDSDAMRHDQIPIRQSAFSAHALLIAVDAQVVKSLGAATNGQIPIGSTGSDPVLTTITGTAGEIDVTNGAGSITLSIPFAIVKAGNILTASTTVVNSVVETTIFTESIAANTLTAGKLLEVSLAGIFGCVNAIDTFDIKAYINATEIASITVTPGLISNYAWRANLIATIRSIGAGGTISPSFTFEAEGNPIVLNDVAETVVIDTTAVCDLTIKITWSAADVANTLTIYQGVITYKN